MCYIRKHLLWFSYWFPLYSESVIAYLSDFPLFDWIWMEPEISYFAIFPYSVQIFSFSSWLELNKNALKSRFLCWCAKIWRFELIGIDQKCLKIAFSLVVCKFENNFPRGWRGGSSPRKFEGMKKVKNRENR